MQPTETELASQALAEESSYRFPYFSANDAVTLGLSLRKRFRASTRYSKGKGLVITVQTIAGHTLFACTVGDLGGVSGVGDVSLDSWSVLEGMVNVVKRTGHSSYYVEKGMSAMSRGQAGLQSDVRVYGGGQCLSTCVSILLLFTRLARQHSRSGWKYAYTSSPFLLSNPHLKFQNALCCPIAVIACYSGSSKDDHHVCRLNLDPTLAR